MPPATTVGGGIITSRLRYILHGATRPKTSVRRKRIRATLRAECWTCQFPPAWCGSCTDECLRWPSSSQLSGGSLNIFYNQLSMPLAANSGASDSFVWLMALYKSYLGLLAFWLAATAADNSATHNSAVETGTVGTVRHVGRCVTGSNIVGLSWRRERSYSCQRISNERENIYLHRRAL